LIVQYKESIAYSKLKDLDFISYKLFKLERAISLQLDTKQQRGPGSTPAIDDMSQLYAQQDDDEQVSPEEYCAEI